MVRKLSSKTQGLVRRFRKVCRNHTFAYVSHRYDDLLVVIGRSFSSDLDWPYHPEWHGMPEVQFYVNRAYWALREYEDLLASRRKTST